MDNSTPTAPSLVGQALSKKEISLCQKALRQENKKYPRDRFVRISEEFWPEIPEGLKLTGGHKRVGVLRSSEYLVSVYDCPHVLARISVIRAEIDGKGHYLQDITWDRLQWIKDNIGFKDYDAVECFPAQDKIVNIANMRHLFVLATKIPFVWGNDVEEPRIITPDRF